MHSQWCALYPSSINLSVFQSLASFPIIVSVLYFTPVELVSLAPKASRCHGERTAKSWRGSSPGCHMPDKGSPKAGKGYLQYRGRDCYSHHDVWEAPFVSLLLVPVQFLSQWQRAAELVRWWVVTKGNWLGRDDPLCSSFPCVWELMMTSWQSSAPFL